MKRIEETGLIVNKRSGAYPKDGQILILAGGAGSGKGHVVKNVLLFQGKTFNVDDLKEKIHKLATVKPKCKFAQLFKQQFDYELKDLDFKNGQQVKDLHFFLKGLGVPEAEKMAFFVATKKLGIKPNVVFDVTLDEMKKLREYSYYAELGGYSKENIHVVWVLTDIEMAKKQNAMRSRTLPEDLLVTTHEGAAMTMFELMNNSQKYQQYADGDIWIVFNTAGIDSSVIRTMSTGLSKSKEEYVTHLDPSIDPDTGHRKGYLAIHVKEVGKPCMKFSQIQDEFKRKILSYVPKTV